MLIVLGMLCLQATNPTTAPAYPLSFDNKIELTAEVWGDGARDDATPHVEDGVLHLSDGWSKTSGAVAFPALDDKLHKSVEVKFKLIMSKGIEGMGFALLNVAKFPDAAAPHLVKWEEPNLEESFGVGFDASDPVNHDPFRGSGNIYDRPQHEISLHFNGMEIVKRVCPVEFRDEKPHEVHLKIEHVTGGAEVTLSVDQSAVYEKYFVASMQPYVARPVFAVRNNETSGEVAIDDLDIKPGEVVDAPHPPKTILAIDKVLNDSAHGTNEAMVEFPAETDQFGRIICTLRLDKPATRFDPWDRIARIWLVDADGSRYELLRYITPYHKGHVWQVDVSDFRPLLRGKKKIIQECGTQGEGWVVTVKFDFHPGPTDRFAYRVINLWSGAPEVGNPDNPTTKFYTEREVKFDERTTGAKVRSVVTGHGMEPNTNNAAEFMPIERTLTVNGRSYLNKLWKEDNYLNPCRPQGGTWKYDRAGWGPGDIVRPWEVDVTEQIDASRRLKIGYALDAYVNEGRGKTWAPTHVTEAQLILYRRH